MYIETFYKDEDQEFAKINYHSFASASGRIMKECEVKESVPIHFSRRYIESDQLEIEMALHKAFHGNQKNLYFFYNRSTLRKYDKILLRTF